MIAIWAARCPQQAPAHSLLSRHRHQRRSYFFVGFPHPTRWGRPGADLQQDAHLRRGWGSAVRVAERGQPRDLPGGHRTARTQYQWRPAEEPPERPEHWYLAAIDVLLLAWVAQNYRSANALLLVIEALAVAGITAAVVWVNHRAYQKIDELEEL